MDTVVIGAGQAGLAMSRWLQKLAIPHVVLERGRVGHSWREQRWDSFHLNTPNVINLLPDDRYEGEQPYDFERTASLVGYFEEYRRRHDLPIEEGVEVTAVRRTADGFEVDTGGETRRCRHLVLCSGDQNAPRIPACAAQVPADIVHVHTADYRAPDQLPGGSVLVVGSGQSGVQIVEDLLDAGRKVYLATSMVGRVPRRYRGKDVLEWMQLAGLTEMRPRDLEDPNEIRAKQPQTSGTNGGHTVSLQQLARDGVTLLGRLDGIDGRVLRIAGDLEAHVAKGDEMSAKIKAGLDMFIAKAGVDAPPAEPDPVEAPFDGIADMAAVRQLDLDDAGIRAIVWATGFGPKFDYLDPALVDERGRPRHTDGVCDVPGLYCLGLTWLRRRVSGLIAGVDRDAEHIAKRIAEQPRS